jgi:hypothetical protein
MSLGQVAVSSIISSAKEGEEGVCANAAMLVCNDVKGNNTPEDTVSSKRETRLIIL